MTPQRFKEIFPYASTSTLKANGLVSNHRSQRHQAPALVKAASGKKAGMARTVISFTGFRVRPLDPDGFAGSVKDLLDGIKHSGLISDDSFWHIRLITEQEQVAHFEEERTEIEITWP